MKRAYLAIGPESSGTRLMSSIIEAGGATRDDKMTTGDDVIVIHRSVPYDGRLPDLAGIINMLRGRGYKVHAVVMVRDPNAAEQSQINARHSLDVVDARRRMTEAVTFLFHQLAHTQCPFVVVPYESLVLAPSSLLEYLAYRIGLDKVPDVEIYDGNWKYYCDAD